MPIRRTIYLTLLLCVTASFLFAQKSVKNLYVAQLEPRSKLIEGTFQKTLEKTKKGSYISKTYYPETKQITHFISYADKKLAIRHGRYQEWFDNGKTWKIGQYENGVITGKWTYYRYKEGWSTGEFVAGDYQGIWEIYREDKSLEETKYYDKGKLNGTRTYYDKTGTVERIETYLNDELISTDFIADSTLLDSSPTSQLERMPILLSCESIEDIDEAKKCSDGALLKAIYSNIQYPQEAIFKGYTGMAYISFIVEKDGSVAEVTTLRGVSRSIEKECLRVLNFMPTWKAGEQNGQPVRMRFNLPVNFKLE